MAIRANSGVIQNSQGNIWLDASQAQNYGLQAGVYTPDQLNNAGNSKYTPTPTSSGQGLATSYGYTPYNYNANSSAYTGVKGVNGGTGNVGAVKAMENNWNTQDYIGVDGGKMRISYDDQGNYTTENFDTGDLSGYDVGSGTNYVAGGNGDIYGTTVNGATGTSSDPGFFGAQAGGSTFANTAAGIGSLMSAFASWKGIGAAKDALNFEKQKYGDLKALQAKSDTNKEKFGLALQSAFKPKVG